MCHLCPSNHLFPSVCALRLAALVKDYCGTLSEKSVQMNFALIYELLDEVVVSPHPLGCLFSLAWFQLGFNMQTQITI